MPDPGQGTFARYVRFRLVAAAFVAAWPWLTPGTTSSVAPIEWYIGWAGLATATALLQRLLRVRIARSPTLLSMGFLFDLVGISFLIGHEGGLYSLFSLLFFGVIAGAAALLGRRAAFVAAGASALGLLAGALVEAESLRGSPPRLISDISLRIFAFFLMAEMVFRTTRYRELELQIEKVLEAVRAGVVVLDKEGRMTSLNPAARAMMGDAEGLPVGGLLRGFGQNNPWEETHKGRRWVCVRSPLPTGGSVLIIEDLTELYLAREHAAREERLAAVGRLAAAFAHEIRNPLAALSGALQMEAEGAHSPMVTLALGEASRLERLVSDFLSSARISTVRPVFMDLEALVQNVVAAVQVDRRYRGLRVTLDTVPVSISGDPDRIQQVLGNLLLNAAQAMPDGGEARVRLRPVLGDGQRPPGVQLEVEDDGAGLPPEEMSRIFDPFYTTRSGGTGLGLAIVEHATRGHGGTVSVRRASTGGLHFTVWLPREASGTTSSTGGDDGLRRG